MTDADTTGTRSHEQVAGVNSLAAALRRTAGLARQRLLLLVVSDFRGPHGWRSPLLDLAGRHDIVAVETSDPREQELAEVGDLRLVDPETERYPRVDTSSPALRRRFADAARDESREVTSATRSGGARHTALTTHGDWIRRLTVFLRTP